jgi:putative tricarboxylic transport membrane protein
MFLQGKLFLKAFVNVTRIPTYLLSAIIIVLCVVGSFSVNNSVFEVWIMLIFGFVGYLMLRVNIPVVPMLLAIILGPIAEESMRQSLILSQGSYAIFVTRPISLLFVILTVCSIGVAIYSNIKKGILN